MITEKRLEELIQQRATVYVYSMEDDFQGVVRIELDENSCGINYEGELVRTGFYSDYFYKLEDIYENKEDAEFAEEFQNITRTETLSLPTFEEFKKFERFDFKAKDGHIYTIHFISGFKTLAITGIIENKYYGEATKENYLEACKIAKKLFLGEK